MKIKLPRKRKKAYIKAKGRRSYMTDRILNEIFQEEGLKHSERFYNLVTPRRGDKRPRYRNGNVITKRW